MTSTLQDKMTELSPERRQKIEAMTAELVGKEQSLQDLRQTLALTQEQIAQMLGIKQDGVSRIEKRSDLLLSTLRRYVRAMGGDLRLVVEFPNRPPAFT